MSGDHDLSDAFDHLLRGGIPGTPAEQDLHAFVEDTRAAFPAQAPAEELYLEPVLAAARLLADKGDPVARPVSNATGRERHASWLPKRRREPVKVPIMRTLAAKVLTGLVVLMSMFGGVAFAGALPGGLQDTVANAVSGIVDLPGGDDELVVDEADDADEAGVDLDADGAADEAEDDVADEDAQDEAEDVADQDVDEVENTAVRDADEGEDSADDDVQEAQDVADEDAQGEDEDSAEDAQGEDEDSAEDAQGEDEDSAEEQD